MTKVCIIGNKGNMGRRYAAVCDYLDIEHWGWDRNPRDYNADDFKDTTHVIIATPTKRHIIDIQNLKDFLAFKGPILCEKPIATNITELKYIDYDNLYMVNNYQYLYQGNYGSHTTYEYYHSGNDGLAWDCIQLFKFTDDSPYLKNQSPIWKCSLHGKKLSKNDIDQSYIDMIKDFTGPMKYCWGKDIIIDLHLKVAKYEIENSHRDSSKDR